MLACQWQRGGDYDTGCIRTHAEQEQIKEDLAAIKKALKIDG